MEHRTKNSVKESNEKSIGTRNWKQAGEGSKKPITQGKKPATQGKKPASAEAFCPYAKRCGGCDYTGLSYPEQLKEKQKALKSLLGGFGPVKPIIGMENPLHYRHKVNAAFDCIKGQVVAGVYAKRSHDVVDIEACRIEDEEADAIVRTVKSLLRSFRIKTYDEDTGYGLLRHVMVRKSYARDEYMVILVVGSPILPSKNNFVKALRKDHPKIATVILNVNDKKTSMVLGDRNITLYGKGYLMDSLCGMNFRLSPNAFYQVNPVQTEKLYAKAMEYAGLTGRERVIDAYCGTGTIGLIASRQAAEVIGVELNRDATRDAIANAKANEATNIRFYNEDAGDFLMEMAGRGEHADLVIMDPPRTGSTEDFLSAVVTLSPSRVVYVSCGPDTLARDLHFLTSHGYRMEEATPVDLFPYTKHVETVVLLSQQRKPDDYLEVEINLDELDATSAETKATYEEIKKYVAEHNNGMKVSNLYIAQVKKKCGIEMAKNFNLPKSENARQPQCPPEKEEAIEEALKVFKMI